MKFKFLLLCIVTLVAIGLAVTVVTQKKNSDQNAVEVMESSELETPKAAVSSDVQDGMIEVSNGTKKNPKSFETTSDMVRFGLAETLGREASFSETYRREDDRWILLCGRLLESDGSPFDYSRSSLKLRVEENLIEDKACLLGEKFDGEIRLQETDIGSLDSPVLSWVVRYDLPTELIK